MPLGTNPPDKDLRVADLTLRDVVELNAIASGALIDGASRDDKVCDCYDVEDDEPTPPEDD